MANAPPPRLAALLRHIRDPANHAVGLPKLDVDAPDRIVLFVRRQGVIMHSPKRNSAQYVLALNLRGKGDVIMDGRRIPLSPNHALLIFPGQLHYYENLDELRMTWLYIGFHLALSESFAMLRNRPVLLSAHARHYVECIASDYTDPERSLVHLASRISLNLWLLLMELVTVRRRLEPVVSAANIPPKMRAAELLRYIEENIGTTLRQKDVAQRMNMSLSMLKRFLREHFNQGLASYVRTQRLYFARGLMATTNLTMTEIAAQCGFSSIYVFSQTFKRVMKITPTAHRAQLTAASSCGSKGNADLLNSHS